MFAVVTGANGFIGSNLVRALAGRGWRVRALSRTDASASGDADAQGPDWRRVDYTDSAALRALLANADVVFHVAGATRAVSDEALWAANVDLTARVVAATADTSKLVLVSSQAAAGTADGPTRARTEDDAPRPVGAYGESKLAAERLAVGHPRSVVVRPAAVYGPGDRDFLQLFRLARRGVAIHPGNRDARLSTVHVDDLVDGIIRAATHDQPSGRTYFLASDDAITWGELFELAAESAGRKIVIDVELPTLLVMLSARVGDAYGWLSGRAGLLTTHKAALAGPQHWVCANARARSEVGFSPSIDLPSGLKQTWTWYLEHGWVRA